MAHSNRTDAHNHDNPPEAGRRVEKKASWLDGLPHNFDGWGPKTPDEEAVTDDRMYAESDLTWAGDVDDRHHYVWNFQRSRHHH